jgi:hypothetical protein
LSRSLAESVVGAIFAMLTLGRDLVNR